MCHSFVIITIETNTFHSISFQSFFEILTHLSLASYKMDIGKQCRPRSDAAERGVWSGSTLSA